jgi:hypothetical protein
MRATIVTHTSPSKMLRSGTISSQSIGSVIGRSEPAGVLRQVL